MPFLSISTSTALNADQVEALRNAIAELMPILPTKNRDNTMIRIEHSAAISMGDAGEPCLFVDVRMFGPSPLDSKQAFVKELSAMLEQRLGMPTNRMYINMIEMDAWGARGNYNVRT